MGSGWTGTWGWGSCNCISMRVGGGGSSGNGVNLGWWVYGLLLLGEWGGI